MTRSANIFPFRGSLWFHCSHDSVWVVTTPHRHTDSRTPWELSHLHLKVLSSCPVLISARFFFFFFVILGKVYDPSASLVAQLVNNLPANAGEPGDAGLISESCLLWTRHGARNGGYRVNRIDLVPLFLERRLDLIQWHTASSKQIQN